MPSSDEEQWRRVETLFQNALDLEPGRRAAFLDRECEHDVALRKEVEELLASSEKATLLLAQPIEGVAQELLNFDDLLGKQIGQYELIRLLGEGGMGRVYLAERADRQYRGRAAVKVMRALLGHRSPMLARFRFERQILANLQHPNIARLLDGGVTSEGLPYLVMEYVDGIAIDNYCRKHNLSIDERLRLFCKVSKAVEYAHHHLVVHRDIKPVNILVDENGEPKLLDFGIAKLLEESPGSGPLIHTRATEYLMTPEYASPEQVRGEPVSTATDVYGLGILLYELLSGNRAFHFETHSPLEIARVICEREPVPPSAALRSASSAGREREKFEKDLDNIVLMAMRKDPAERYSSVALLSADIQSYLDGYPIQARHHNWAYRLSKFIRRHKLGFSAAVTAVFILIAFSVGMGLLANRANREQQKAQREAEFMASMFRAASPEEARGHEITARDLLDRGAQRIDKELASEPDVRIPLVVNIAQAYSDLGAYDSGLDLLKRSLPANGSLNGVDPLEQATILDTEATLYRLKANYKAADPLFRRALAIRRKELTPSDPLVADSLTHLGECLYLEQQDVEAESMLRAALAIRRGENPDNGMDVRNYLALLLKRNGEFSEAAQLLSAAVTISKRVDGIDSPSYQIILHNWASTLIDAGNLQEAEKQFRELLPLRRRIIGNNHPDLAYTLNNLGYVLLDEGRPDDAAPFLRENLALVRRIFGDDNPSTVAAWNNWARYQQAIGNYADAKKYYQRALNIAAKQSTESWAVAKIEGNLGTLAFDEGDYRKAEHLARGALAMRKKLGADDAPIIATSLLEVSLDRLYQGDDPTAESLASKALHIREHTLKPQNPAIVAAELRLAETLAVEGKFAEAEPYLQRSVEYVHHPPFSLLRWQVAEAEQDYAFCERALGKNVDLKLSTRPSDLKNDPQPVFREAAAIRLPELARRTRLLAASQATS
ncbi:MAG TPA: serine/threonine-protein kinase, partial [Bryobacteraceae bacterium]